MTAIGFIQQTSNDIDSQIIPKDYRHALCFGDTGSGKTATFIMPNLKERIEQGNSIVFMDHKGHEHQKIKHFSIEADRLDDVVEIGKPHGAYINFMDIFDSDALQAAIAAMLGGIDKDPYWSGSASKLAVRCVEIHRKYYEIGKTLEDFFDVDKKQLEVILEEGENGKVQSVLQLHEEPSFQTLSKILATPKTLKQFFTSMKKLSTAFDKKMATLYIKHEKDFEKKSKLVHLMTKHFQFSDLLEAYGEFSIDSDSSEASGNNGVLQVINNAIATIATLPSMNHSEVNMMELIEDKSIIIIDTQSISTDLYGILLESLMKSLASRIKHETPDPVSIFIDEANRVLPPKIDLSNDVMRESKVELILSAQNEHQMIVKFGKEQWKAISENILHRYTVDNNHRLYCYHEIKNAKPILLEKETLEGAEYQYNALAANRSHITQRFLFNTQLPTDFLIHYNLHHFSHKGELPIVDREQNREVLLFVGEKNKGRLSAKVERLKAIVIMQREEEREQLKMDLYDQGADRKIYEDIPKYF